MANSKRVSPVARRLDPSVAQQRAVNGASLGADRKKRMNSGSNGSERSKPSTASSSSGKVGVRQRLKQERQERIIAAARVVFAEKGFESATLRQIAGNAGLGIATLFNYVTDKRDLIYLIFNEEMEELVDKALAAPRTWQSFEAKLLSVTEPHYRLFAQEPVLSRILLSEVMLQTPGFHLGRFRSLRQRLIDGIEKLVSDAQKTGEVDTEESADMIARHIFFSFSIAILWWVASPQPHWRDGQVEYQRVLNLQMNGLRPKQRTIQPPIEGR